MLCLRTSARLFCVAPLCARASFSLASLSRGLRFTLFNRLHVYPGFRLTYFCVLRGLRIPSLFFGLLRLHYGLPRMLLFVFSAFSFLSFLSGFRSVSVLLFLTWTVSFGVSYLVGLSSASVLSWTVSVGVSSFQCVVSFSWTVSIGGSWCLEILSNGH